MNSVSLIAVYEANGGMPEQHGERSDAKLHAKRLRVG
jgi:hypothetical protein